MAISGLLNIAWGAISSNQIAMNVTGANVANVNTPGYTRQRADFTAVSNVKLSSGQADFGVRVDSIERLYNRYIETQLLDQSQQVGYDTASQEILGRVESVFNESSTGGLSDSLNQFWNSWETLSSDPTNQVARYAVVSAANNLATLFRESSKVLISAQQDIQDSMAATKNDINGLTTQIADLNGQILLSGSEDGSSNNILDRRLELLKSLADKINISYYENTDGTINVYLANGNILVGGDRSNQLDVIKDSTGNNNIIFKNSPTQILNDAITGGRLGAMMATGETTLSGYLDSLDQLADGIVKAVNDLHTVEWDAGSAVGDPVSAENNQYTGAVSSSGTYAGTANHTYVMQITTGGVFGDAKYQISTDGGAWVLGNTIAGTGVISLDGGVGVVQLTFADTTKPLVAGDTFTVNVYDHPGLYKKGLGEVFFDDQLAGAENVRVSAAILADPRTVVASVTGNDGFIHDPVPATWAVGLLAVTKGGAFTGDVNTTYEMKITTGGEFGVAKYQISSDGGDTWGDEQTTDAADGVISLGDGVTLTFTGYATSSNMFTAGNTFSVTAHPATDFFNARQIGATKDNLSMNGGVSTFNDFYATLVGRVGYDVRAVDSNIARNTAVTNQLLAQRESASGVSLDEEVINLMKYQFGYGTAGRLAKAANDMLDVLMALGQ